jgi:hypothetical protein
VLPRGRPYGLHVELLQKDSYQGVSNRIGAFLFCSHFRSAYCGCFRPNSVRHDS